MRLSPLIAAAAAMSSMSGVLVEADAAAGAFSRSVLDFLPPDDGMYFPRGMGRKNSHAGHSHRDTEHERDLARLARKARRQTRLHGHSASSRRALMRTSAA